LTAVSHAKDLIMSESNVSQSQQAPSAWKKLVDDHVARMDLAFGEAARLEGQGLEHARTAFTEVARLSQDTFAFWGQLTSEWRKLSLDATRRVGELITPKG
jgi:hypothetical protein